MSAKRKELPPRTEWAFDRLMKAARAEGLASVQLGFNFGDSTVGHASLFDGDGNQTFYWFDGKSWFEHVEVE